MKEQDAITPRPIKFGIAKNPPKYWYNNDVVKTIHANTLTASIPYGERFFVACVLPFIKQIPDRTFRKNALNFLKQEINHSKEHYRLFLKVVRPHYPKLKIKNSFHQNCFLLFAYLVGKKMRLSIVAATEHFTAVWGEFYLRDPALMEGVEEKIKSLWQWHFLEEIEHKAVAFDIFQAAGGGYMMRAVGFFCAAFFLITGFMGNFLHMVFYDKLYNSKSFYYSLYQFLFKKPGILKHFWTPYFRYLLPSFHPNKYGNDLPLKEISEKFLSSHN